MEVGFLVYRSCDLGAVLSFISDLPNQRTEIEVFGSPILCIDKASVVVWILRWLLLSELAASWNPTVVIADRATAFLNERRVFELLFGHSE